MGKLRFALVLLQKKVLSDNSDFILSDFENIELNYDDIREITTAVH